MMPFSVSPVKQPSVTDSGVTENSSDTAASSTQSSKPATSSSDSKETKSRKRSAILLPFEEIAPKKSVPDDKTGLLLFVILQSSNMSCICLKVLECVTAKTYACLCEVLIFYLKILFTCTLFV